MRRIFQGPQTDVPRLADPPASLHWIAFDPMVGWPHRRPAAAAGSPAEALPEFAKAIRNAQLRIWIVDPYFDYWCGYASIADACLASRARDIWILSGEHDQLTRDIRDDRCDVPRRIAFRALRNDFVHDRFALVDDDLWHFGSTVGGGYHRVSAASRGWTGRALEFQVLFQNLWAQAGQ
jgi:hypothetical protein